MVLGMSTAPEQHRDDDDVIGTAEAARILGVDRSTFRGYSIPGAWTTPGGHHRFTRAAVLEFRDQLRHQTA